MSLMAWRLCWGTKTPFGLCFVSVQPVRECYGLSVKCLWLVAVPSCREENDPDPKSGRDLDLDKPVCASCLEDVTESTFLHSFLWFSSCRFGYWVASSVTPPSEST